jgi:aminomethyltransferase
MSLNRAPNLLLSSFKRVGTSSAGLQQTSVRLSTHSIALQAVQPRKPTPPWRQTVRYVSSHAKGEELGKTGLYELHSKYGAKFVPFGGYSMPVQYSNLGIVDSHNWTREKASLFDVGHM